MKRITLALALWLTPLVWSQEESVLVLPLTPSNQQVPAEAGLYLSNRLEQWVILHPKLKANWLNWSYADYLKEQSSALPFAQSKLRGRYFLSGSFDGQQLKLTWHDRTSGKDDHRDLPLDLPGGEKLGTEFQAWLEELGFPAQIKAHWHEPLSLPEAAQLGGWMKAYYSKGPLPETFPKVYEGSALALNLHGWASWRKQPDKAQLDFERALQLFPNCYDAMDGRVQVALAQDRPEEGIEWAERASQLRGQEPSAGRLQALEDYVRRLARNRKWAETESYLDRIQALGLPSKAGIIYRFYFWLNQNKVSQAESWLLAAPDYFTPEDQKPLRYSLARKQAQSEKSADSQVLAKLWKVAWEAANDDEDRWEAGLEYAHKLNQCDRYELALEVLDKLGEDAATPSQKLHRLCLRSLALIGSNRKSEGLAGLRATHHEAATLTDLDDRMLLLLRLANGFRRAGAYGEAWPVWQQLLEVGSKLPPEVKVYVTNQAFLALLGDSRLEQAAPLGLNLIDQMASAKSAQTDEVRVMTGAVLVNLKRDDQAMPLLQQALLNAGLEAYWVSEAHLQLGRIQARRNHAEAAVTEFVQGAAAARQGKDLKQEYFNLEDSVSQLRGLGATGRELESAQRLLQLAIEMKDPERCLRAHQCLAVTYATLRQEDKAVAHCDQALKLNPNPLVLNKALRYKADLLRRIGRLDEAADFARQAIDQAKRDHLSDPASLPADYAMMATVRQEQNRLDEARQWYEQALKLLSQGQDPDLQGRILFRLGQLEYLRTQIKPALEHFRQAWKLCQDDTPSERATRLTAFMRCYAALGRPRLAVFYGKQAVNIYQKTRGDLAGLDETARSGFDRGCSRVYRQLADLLVTQERLEEAQQVLDLLKGDEFRHYIRETRRGDSEIAQSAALTPAETRWAGQEENCQQTLAQLSQQRLRLLKMSGRSAAEEKNLSQIEKKLEEAAQAYRKFQDDLAQEVGKARPERLEQLKDARALMADLGALGKDTVMIYTLVGEHKLRLVVFGSQVRKAFEVPVEAVDLRRAIFKLRGACTAPDQDPRPAAQELYNLVLKPLEPELQGLEAHCLLWSLDGPLRYVPLAALYDGKQFAVERYRQVVITPASHARLKERPQPKSWKLLALGVSEGGHGQVPLPSVKRELSAIHEIFPGEVRLDANFTKANFARDLAIGYPAVHIASHFVFSPGSAKNCELLLGGGETLNLADLDEMDAPFRGVELLTLSACSTAVGDHQQTGSEVEGLAVLAQRQGAQAVMATLWSVADESTAELMTRFYTAEKTTSSGKAEALRQAQLSLLRGKWSHPVFWAPFVVMGNSL